MSDTMLGRPRDVAVDGTSLWVLDGSGTPFVHRFDLRDGRHLESFGRRGDGPGEFRYPKSFAGRRDGGSVTVVDPTSLRLTHVRGARRDTDARSDVVPLPAGLGLESAVAVAGGFAVWSRLENPRVLVLDERGVERGRATERFPFGDSIPVRARMLVTYRVSLCARPDGRTFAVAFAYAGRIERRRADGMLDGLVEVTDSGAPAFARARNGQLTHRRTRFFYSDCTADEEFVYAIHSGQPDGVESPDGSIRNAAGATSLEIYDWTGRLRSKHALSDTLTAIAISVDRQWLYGASAVDATILRFPNPAAPTARSSPRARTDP